MKTYSFRVNTTDRTARITARLAYFVIFAVILSSVSLVGFWAVSTSGDRGRFATCPSSTYSSACTGAVVRA